MRKCSKLLSFLFNVLRAILQGKLRVKVDLKDLLDELLLALLALELSVKIAIEGQLLSRAGPRSAKYFHVSPNYNQVFEEISALVIRRARVRNLKVPQCFGISFIRME